MAGTFPRPHHRGQNRLDRALSNAFTALPSNGSAAPDNTADQADYLGLSDTNITLGDSSMTTPFQPPPELSIQDFVDPEDPLKSRESELVPFPTSHRAPARPLQDSLEFSGHFANGWVSGPQGSTDAQPWSAVAATESCAQGHNERQHPGMNPKDLLTPQRRSMVYSEPDSGYYSYPGSSSRYAASIVSNPTSNFNWNVQRTSENSRTVAASHQLQVMGPRLRNVTSQANLRSPQNDAQSENQDEMNVNLGTISCDEEDCDWHGKTQSDLKKHKDRHQLGHVCREAGCPRAGKGFATRNDLDRHKAGKHGIYSSDQRFWKCFAQGCSKTGKLWHRLDNFKEHIRRMHKSDDVEVIIARAENWWNPQISPPQPAPGPSTRLPTTSLDHTLGHQSTRPATDHEVHDPDGAYPFNSNVWSNFDMSSLLGQSMTPVGQFHALGASDRRYSSSGYATASTVSPQSYNRMRSPHTTEGLGFLALQNITAQVGIRPAQGSVMVQRSTSFDPRMIGDAGNLGGFAHQLGPTTSVYQPPNTISSIKNYAKTVADPRSTQKQHAELTRSYPASSASSGPQIPYAPSHDVVAQVGSHHDLHGLHSASTSVPNIAVNQGDNPRLDPQHIHDFLVRNSRPKSDVGIHVTGPQGSNMLRTLEPVHSSTSKSSSKETLEPSAEAEEYMEPVNENGKAGFRCKGLECSNRLWERRSLIIKHVRRHTKPYGCTFEHCYKRFGSKNDWKRHEQGQHIQQECWRCEEAASRTRPDVSCHKLHWTREDYVNHLNRWHEITATKQIESQCRIGHIDLNAQPQFWCGFCKSVLPLRNRHNFKNERFDHIARHYINEKRKIGDWLLPAGIKTKGQVQGAEQPVEARGYHDDESTSDSESEGDGVSLAVETSHQPDLLSPQRPSQVALGKRKRSQSSTSLSDQAGPSSGVPIDADEHQHRRPRLEAAEYWTCCHCPPETGSVWTWVNYMSCMVCQHARCSHCTPLRFSDPTFGNMSQLQ